MRKIYLILVITALISVGSFYISNDAYALLNTASPSAKPIRFTQREILQKEKALKEIDRRVISLTNLIDRVSEVKKLSDVDKTQLMLQAQDQITSLTFLKAKIETDEDQASLKADRQAIYNEYRIYLIFIPKIHVLVTADRITEILADIDQIIQKLQDRISKDKLAGEDVTALESLLTDLQNKLTEVNIQAQAAQDLVTPLAPDQGDLQIAKSNQEKLKNARAKLVLAKKGLADLVADINKIRIGLSKIEKDKVATSSATR